MKNNTLKKITIILIIILISLISFVGIYARDLNKMKNIMPDYKVGMDFDELHELRFDVDQSTETKYYDANGNETTKPKEDETDTVKETEDEASKEEEIVAEESIDEKEETTKKDEITSKEVPVNPDEVLTAENFEKVKKIISKRLSVFGMNEYYYRQDENGYIVIQLPESDNVNEYKELISATGKLEIKDDETKEILLDQSLIKEVFASTHTDDDNSITALLVVNFNEEGRAKLEEISKKYIKTTKEEEEGKEETEEAATETEEAAEAAEEIKAIEISIDGEVLYRTYFGPVVTSGQLPIAIGSESKDKQTILENYEKAVLLAEILKSGTLPIKYNLASENIYSSILRQEVVQMLTIIMAIILAVLVVFLTIRYNKGLLMSISWIGFISAYLLLLKFTNSVITMNSIISIIIICAYDYIFLCNLLSKKNNKSFGETLKRFIIIGIPLCIISLAFSFAGILTVSSFGIALFWGIALMVLYNLVITKNLHDEN